MVRQKYQLNWKNWKTLWKETDSKGNIIEGLEETDTGPEVKAEVLIAGIVVHGDPIEGLTLDPRPGREEVGGGIHSVVALIVGQEEEGVIVIARITIDHNVVIGIGIKIVDLVHETDMKDAESPAILDVAMTVGEGEVTAEVTANDLITDDTDLIHERNSEDDPLLVVEHQVTVELRTKGTGQGVRHLSGVQSAIEFQLLIRKESVLSHLLPTK